jgi:hypothetical protein
MENPQSSAFYGEQAPSGICPVVSVIFDALARCDAPDEYKIGALRSAINFYESAVKLQRRLPPDMLCIPLNGDRN